MSGDKRNPGSLLEKRLADPKYRRRFEKAHYLFEIEVQIRNALERKGWTFEDLAKALGTQKSNISRDLNGGLRSASLSRIVRIGEVLGLSFHGLFIPKKKDKEFSKKLPALIAS